VCGVEELVFGAVAFFLVFSVLIPVDDIQFWRQVRLFCGCGTMGVLFVMTEL
jgi:hypothetical protein